MSDTQPTGLPGSPCWHCGSKEHDTGEHKHNLIKCECGTTRDSAEPACLVCGKELDKKPPVQGEDTPIKLVVPGPALTAGKGDNGPVMLHGEWVPSLIVEVPTENLRCQAGILLLKHGHKMGDKIDAGKVQDYLVEFLAAAERSLSSAREEIDDYDRLINLQHSRTVKADKLWQEAHNKPDTTPDLGALVDWLMERADRLESAFAEAHLDADEYRRKAYHWEVEAKAFALSGSSELEESKKLSTELAEARKRIAELQQCTHRFTTTYASGRQACMSCGETLPQPPESQTGERLTAENAESHAQQQGRKS
jgi:hypothetical protein